MCPAIAERNTAHVGVMGVRDNLCKQEKQKKDWQSSLWCGHKEPQKPSEGMT